MAGQAAPASRSTGSLPRGHLTPVYFGSGPARLWRARSDRCAGGKLAPPPRAQEAATAWSADEPKMTGFVFKIQANMDPNHRDRIAFMRVCSGKLTRGMKAKLVRTGKPMALTAPQFFFAQDSGLLLTRPMRAMWSAFPTTARCASATR
jgi:peptide chain release factor 3